MTTANKVLQQIGVGKANAMRVAKLEQAIGGQPSGTNNDATRRLVAEMIEQQQIPIGSSSGHGYWLIDSDAECDEVCDAIAERIAGLLQKKNNIRYGWERRKASKASGGNWPL